MDNIQKPIEWQDEDNNTLDFDYKATESGHAAVNDIRHALKRREIQLHRLAPYSTMSPGL